MNAKQSALAKIRERVAEFADLASVHFDNGKTLVTFAQRAATTSLATCADSVWILKFEGDAMTSWLRANTLRSHANPDADQQSLARNGPPRRRRRR